MDVLFIYRAQVYSPNNVERDAAILEAVAQRMKTLSHSIEIVPEEKMPSELEHYDLIVHMTRRLSSLIRLERLGLPCVVNAPQGVRNVAQSRELTLMLLSEAGVSVPPWWAYDPEDDEMFVCDRHLQSLLPGWVKAMRPSGALPEDVTYVKTPLEADSRILELSAQQVPDIVVTRHLEGDLLKCYYVHDPEAAVPFLRCFYPQEQGYSKFGNAEQLNSPLRYIPFDERQLLDLAQRIARALQLRVFGFDVIVHGPSEISVIDVNDWPTFSCFREEAADAIVNCILHAMQDSSTCNA